MLDDIRAMIWKEWTETLLQRNRSRRERVAVAGLVIAIFAILLWRSGPVLMSAPQAPLAPSILPLFFLIGIIADSFAGERERHTLETLLASRLSDEIILLGKLIAAVLLVWLTVIVCVGLVLASVSLMGAGTTPAWFRSDVIVPGILLYCLLSLAIGCASVLVSLRAAGVRQAMQIMNIGLIVTLFSFLYAMARLPIEWQARLAGAFMPENLFRTEVIAGTILLALSILLFGAARLRFKRDRLLLD